MEHIFQQIQNLLYAWSVSIFLEFLILEEIHVSSPIFNNDIYHDYFLQSESKAIISNLNIFVTAMHWFVKMDISNEDC